MPRRLRSVTEKGPLHPRPDRCVDNLLAESDSLRPRQRSPIVARFDGVGIAEAPLIVTRIVKILKDSPLVCKGLLIHISTHASQPVTPIHVEA